MIQIRKNVFETNSSSSHSLVYTHSTTNGRHYAEKDTEVYLFEFYGDEPEKNILAISFANYGWGPFFCKNLRSKLSYMFTQLADGSGFDYWRSGAKHTTEIKTQADWDKFISEFKQRPEVQRLIKFVQDNIVDYENKKPITDIKFVWYNIHNTSDLIDCWQDYQEQKLGIPWEKCSKEIPTLDEANEAFRNFVNFDRHHFDDEDGGIIPGLGYIDHQSYGFLTHLSDEMLKKILLDNEIWIAITNDNN